MGCCNSKNKIEDVNAEAIRHIEARDLPKKTDNSKQTDNRSVKLDENRPKNDNRNAKRPEPEDNSYNNNTIIVVKQQEARKPVVTNQGSSSILDKQVEEWKSLIESLTSNSRLMNYALAKTRTEFKYVSDVGAYLAACRDAQTATEKAWLVYVWVTHNIAYDTVSFFNSDYRFCNPQSVLERGLAVCAGYADLYKTLCAQLGVQCISISGYSKGFGYKVGQKMTKEDHAWNAAPIGSDGKLRFIESTWGAGSLNDNNKFKHEFKPYYFAVPAHIFNESHHSDSYTPTDGTKKFTLEEFENCPSNKLSYHVLGLTCVNNTMRAITRTNKNPLVIEYTAPQKIYFTTKLVDERTGREFKDGILVQSEYSSSKDQKSRYCLIADIPEKGRNYKLQLFAKNRHNSQDEEKTYPMITEFLVIREGDEESSIPRYNLTFDYDLRVTSPFSRYIKFKTNPLIMEFEAPNNSQTPQKIYFSTKLVEENTNREITNAAVVQSEYAMFKDQKSKYCLIADIPEKGRKYKLELFAKNKHSSEDNVNTFPILTEFIVIREGDEESYIPQYNVTFAHDIKLKSHYCQFIKFKTNPLVMEFEVPKHIKTLFEVKTMDDREIEDAVFSQINPENSKTILQVAIPRKGEKFLLKIYAKHVRNQSNTFGFVSQIFLIRTQSNKNDTLRFCKVFTRGQDCFIYSPVEYYLASNSLYEFRYFIKDALDVAIIDSSKQWSYLNRYSQDPNTWILNTALTAKGKANVFAKFDQNSSFDGICYYEVN